MLHVALSLDGGRNVIVALNVDEALQLIAFRESVD